MTLCHIVVFYIRKLSAYDINTQLLRWLNNFLCNRTQRVTVNDDTSNWYEVSSGVPQGSVLGPLLFTIYANEIPNLVSSTTQMFADDIKISGVIIE